MSQAKTKVLWKFFAAKSLIITCDTCETLEWIIVVTVFRYIVSSEASGAFFVPSKPLLHCCANPITKVVGARAYPLYTPHPQEISKSNRQTASVNPALEALPLKLGSGKVAGKFLIVDHMCWSARLVINVNSVTNWRFGVASNPRSPLQFPTFKVRVLWIGDWLQ